MSAKTIAAIAFKLFAIYVFVQVLVSGAGLWGVFHSLTDFYESPISLAALPYVMGLAFLVVGLSISVLLFKLGSSVLKALPEDAVSDSVHDTEALLLQMLGAYFAVTALAYLPTNIPLAFSENLYSPGDYAELAKKVEVGVHLAKLLLGVTMIIKVDSWKRLFRRFRYAGSP